MTCGSDRSEERAVRKALARLIQHPHFAIFSAADGLCGSCPHCGTLVELPDLSTAKFLCQRSLEIGAVENGRRYSLAASKDWLRSI